MSNASMSSGHVARVRKLFKLILRLHRNLPSELQVLGDNYVKEEFKRHKNCKPQEAHTFLHAWQDYAARMLRQASPLQAQHPGKVDGSKVAWGPDIAVNDVGTPRFGDNLTSDVVVSMKPDQLYNLYMLLANARGVDPDNAEFNSLDVETYVNKIKEARMGIIELEKIEKDKIARGVIKKQDRTFNSSRWIELFDVAVMKDLADMESIEKSDKSPKKVSNDRTNNKE